MDRQSKGISLKKIIVTDRFLKREMELARTEVIPYQWDALNDNVEGAEDRKSTRLNSSHRL